MADWTGGRWNSTLHRVGNPPAGAVLGQIDAALNKAYELAGKSMAQGASVPRSRIGEILLPATLPTNS